MGDVPELAEGPRQPVRRDLAGDRRPLLRQGRDVARRPRAGAISSKGGIYGIEPGAGETKPCESKVRNVYGLDGEYELVRSNTSAMLAQLDRAYRKNPEKARGADNRIRTLATKGFPGKYSELNVWPGDLAHAPGRADESGTGDPEAGVAQEDEGVGTGSTRIRASSTGCPREAAARGGSVVRSRPERARVVTYWRTRRIRTTMGPPEPPGCGAPPAGGAGRTRISNSAPRPTTSRPGG
ncbi:MULTISPECIES: glycine betaine ABC transporter substrate-binding protein [Streptomyces]|uniref:glycine betaine ABC transporter substrate-binding protein n=1 Tax=Streptomyces TaxID=1883 RepID=UPI0015C50A0B